MNSPEVQKYLMLNLQNPIITEEQENYLQVRRPKD